MLSGKPDWLDDVSCSCWRVVGLKPTLLVLAEFSFQCANVLDAMFKHHALCRQLLVHFPAQVVYLMSV